MELRRSKSEQFYHVIGQNATMTRRCGAQRYGLESTTSPVRGVQSNRVKYRPGSSIHE